MKHVWRDHIHVADVWSDITNYVHDIIPHIHIRIESYETPNPHTTFTLHWDMTSIALDLFERSVSAVQAWFKHFGFLSEFLSICKILTYVFRLSNIHKLFIISFNHRILLLCFHGWLKKSFWRTHVLFWGHWYPCFGFLVMSPLGFKVRVGSALFAF